MRICEPVQGQCIVGWPKLNTIKLHSRTSWNGSCSMTAADGVSLLPFNFTFPLEQPSVLKYLHFHTKDKVISSPTTPSTQWQRALKQWSWSGLNATKYWQWTSSTLNSAKRLELKIFTPCKARRQLWYI